MISLSVGIYVYCMQSESSIQSAIAPGIPALSARLHVTSLLRNHYMSVPSNCQYEPSFFLGKKTYLTCHKHRNAFDPSVLENPLDTWTEKLDDRMPLNFPGPMRHVNSYRAISLISRFAAIRISLPS